MKAQAQPPTPPGLSSAARPWFKIIWIWGLPIACIILIAAIPIAFAIGAVIGNTQVYHIFSERQQARIEQYLGSTQLHLGNFLSSTLLMAGPILLA